MAPHLRGVLFGPSPNWGQGNTKFLLEIDRDSETKNRRQLVLENITN